METTKERKMFCYQCEQTACGTGCTQGGICGKPPATAIAQDTLTEDLVRLALIKETKGGALSPLEEKIITDGLFACVTNVNFDLESIRRLSAEIRRQSGWLSSGENGTSFELPLMWEEPDDVRSLKSLILFGLRGMAAYASHAAALGSRDTSIGRFMVHALAALATEHDPKKLFDLVLELGKTNYRCMALLDEAHIRTFGTPSPAKVSLDVEQGPFIVVTGHDLKDLRDLLEQTEGKGVNVYTHGEMLPAHGYPALRRFPHLKGNFGTAWQNQQREFEDLPAPILWTTNCLMPPKSSYADRVWTTGPVQYPGVRRVPKENGRKDFSGLIDQAIQLGGWKGRRSFTGINGGTHVTTGYGHVTLLSLADKIVQAVKHCDITRLLVVGGCDGAKPGRNYFTQLVQQAPRDWMILTLACGKYRFNDLDLGTINGIPRLVDLGQCNDAYGVIQVALGLAKAFGCGINQLPLSIVLSWYEQKAVAVLLTLLALGIRGIRVGPTLPAFITPKLLETLKEKYEIRPTTNASDDLEAISTGWTIGCGN